MKCSSQSVIMCYASIFSPPNLPDSSVLQAELDSWAKEAPHSSAPQPTSAFPAHTETQISSLIQHTLENCH